MKMVNIEGPTENHPQHASYVVLSHDSCYSNLRSIVVVNACLYYIVTATDANL